MKNVLIISASPRKSGNSDTLSDEFARGAKEAGHVVTKIFLRDKNINFCTGCCYCVQHDYNGCSLHDDMDELNDLMVKSDVILLSSPVYFYTVNGQMKTFLDRCTAKYTKMNNKEFYFIVTAADKDEAGLKQAADCFRGFLDCLDNPTEKGCIYAAGLWHKGEAKHSKYKQQAYDMGFNI